MQGTVNRTGEWGTTLAAADTLNAEVKVEKECFRNKYVPAYPACPASLGHFDRDKCSAKATITILIVTAYMTYPAIARKQRDIIFKLSVN